jgi:RNA polymerase sigma factor (sigma-70 family)
MPTDLSIPTPAALGALERLARREASRFGWSGLSWADLRQEAWCGLYEARAGWDATRGSKFSTYALECIRGRLKRAVSRERRHWGQVSLALIEHLPDPHPGPEALALQRDEEERACRLLSTLRMRERLAIAAACLTEHRGDGSYTQLAQAWGVDLSRVGQLRRQGLERLLRGME